MSRIMFIDGSHREQTRVAVTEKGRVIEFDIESFGKKQNIGNIYLAKITRVEPSLQAAFVEYGGGRQGFLSFSEIHPDYYQIPLEDRKRLLDEAAAFYNNQNDSDDDLVDDMIKDVINDEENHINDDIDGLDLSSHTDDDILETLDENEHFSMPLAISEATISDHSFDDTLNAKQDIDTIADTDDVTNIDNTHETDSDEVTDNLKKSDVKKPRLPRYKIQEVIKKRQILLVQVIKSERGNKGAALTTYLSLAGRYCVLMPNTARGGGISRKITNIADRQKLRSIIKEFQVPMGMGLIIRTAGLQRTKTELRRDYEYLLRLWDNVRQLTMTSIAPALVYEEGDLIKRALRDIYTRDTTKIMIQGENAYKESCSIMKMIMPSSTKSIQYYNDPVPLFSRYKIERQLDELSLSEVTLKSGGYLVINHTEALIAIDVNSGKSTNSYSIEETALRTNLEAAEEISRQLRLRDLAGLIVIDFIDMEEYNNVKAIERKMRDCLKSDKARLQITPISVFGLMEMTRQRLRPTMKDLMSVPCSHCHGMGYVPSLETSALRVLRAIFEEISQKSIEELTLNCSIEIANYLLNKKRRELLAVEDEYALVIHINGSTKCANLEYEINSFLKDVSHNVRPPKIYQDDAYDDGLLDDDTEIVDEVKEEVSIEEDDTIEVRGRARNNKRRRSNNKRFDKDTKSEIENIDNDNDINSSVSNEKIANKTRTDARHDNKRSKFGRKRTRYSDRLQPEADIYVTASGNEVIIENAVSVRNPVTIDVKPENHVSQDNNQQNSEQSQNFNLDNANLNNASVNVENVIVENRVSVKSVHMHQVVSSFEEDAEVLTKVENAPELCDEKKVDVLLKEARNKQDSFQLQETSISIEDRQNDITPSEQQKPARRGWWRNRFGL